MRKLALYILASSLCLAVALSGCGGSGGNSSNGTGGGNATVTGNLAYVDGCGLTGYSIDGATGALKPISGASYTGDHAVVAPNGKLIYCQNGFKLRTYAINSQTGVLTTSGEDNLMWQVSSVTLHPNGRAVYTCDEYGQKITTYSIDANGVIGSAIGNEMALTKGYLSARIAVDPKGRYACISEYKTGEALVTVCSIDSTGALTAKSPISLKEMSSNNQFNQVWKCSTVTFDPTGEFALVNLSCMYAIQGSWQDYNKVYTYNIKTDSWQLVPNSPCDAVKGEMVFSPDGRFVYFVSDDERKITLAKFTADGLITTTDITVMDGTPGSMTFDPTGKFAYVTYDEVHNEDVKKEDDKVVCYSVNTSTGVLTKLSSTTIEDPESIMMIKR